MFTRWADLIAFEENDGATPGGATAVAEKPATPPAPATAVAAPDAAKDAPAEVTTDAEPSIDSLLERFNASGDDGTFTKAELKRISGHEQVQNSTAAAIASAETSRKQIAQSLGKTFREDLPTRLQAAYDAEIKTAAAEERPVSPSLINQAVNIAITDVMDQAELAVMTPHVDYASNLIGLFDGNNPAAKAFLAGEHSVQEWINGVANAATRYGQEHPDEKVWVKKAEADKKLRGEVDKAKPAIGSTKSETGKPAAVITKETYQNASSEERQAMWKEHPDEVRAL